MPNDNEKRLERERALHDAKRGPDYSWYFESLRKERQEAAKGEVMRSKFLNKQKQRWRDNGER